MNCIIVDDEPLARKGLQILIEKTNDLELLASLSNAIEAAKFLKENTVDLIFLDIQMPGNNGIELAHADAGDSLIIFTTAYPEYAIDSYEVDAVDYLLKPIKPERFNKAVQKALTYRSLLDVTHVKSSIEEVNEDYFFVKADRKIFRIDFDDILFIEGLKDYVVIHTHAQRLITAMNIKTIHEKLPVKNFARVSKSYVVNIQKIASFDNNTVFIQKQEIPIGNNYRNDFFEGYVSKKLLRR